MLHPTLKNILLITVVLIVWITLSYRVVTTFYPESIDNYPSIETKKNFSTNVTDPQKKIEINKHLRDPFLGTYEKKRDPSTKIYNSEKIIWPVIQYQGMMENSDTGQILYFIRIQDKIQFWRKGNEYHEVKLIRGNKENIWVKYKGASQKIALSP